MHISGGCHCGAVRWEADVRADSVVHCCNCSMCNRVGFEHVIVPAKHFRLVAGEDDLTTYTFNTGVAQHRFCTICGVKSFYIPRSNPDGVSLNYRCMEAPAGFDPPKEPLDGQNWEDNAGRLKHLSE